MGIQMFHVIIIIFLPHLKMTMNFTASRRATLATAIQSESSSDAQTPKHQDRLRTLRTLKTKKNSVIELIKGSKSNQGTKAQSSTLFQSERWNFRPQVSTNLRDSVTSSGKIVEDNPFLRAKQELLNKKKNSNGESLSGKSVEPQTEEIFEDEEITTFRLLKKGSMNTSIVGTTFENI